VDTHFKQNRKQVVKTLNDISNLSKFKELLENEDYEAIYNEMESVNKKRNIERDECKEVM
jgi:prephenate dehydrogenase